ncbi:TfoX/Sxy family DNA transformation protein [Celeribacter ethanolicus]|uniref:Competence protein TfoX n=1 Tax=Celeribacter ethanolicus TaxID=1758178 RepID=A0A291G8U7_9RHOB|nr:TfoX/Sxy family DNA transformation protein [Celeribacter ethanolicus]ATG46601.1 competence protein TfoX [Celeribacter ethanolicus]
MPTPVSSIRNLGPASDASFARAGITSAEELREMGADAAYRHLLTHGSRPHFIGYYCIVMGLQGRPWNDCKGKEKDELRARFDAIVASVQEDKTAVPLGIEAILNDIGTGLRR